VHALGPGSKRNSPHPCHRQTAKPDLASWPVEAAELQPRHGWPTMTHTPHILQPYHVPHGDSKPLSIQAFQKKCLRTALRFLPTCLCRDRGRPFGKGQRKSSASCFSFRLYSRNNKRERPRGVVALCFWGEREKFLLPDQFIYCVNSGSLESFCSVLKLACRPSSGQAPVRNGCGAVGLSHQLWCRF
jgi:hypothetical protein